MKTNILKLSMLLLTAAQITPAHAMLARASQAALRSGMLRTSNPGLTATAATGIPQLQPNPTLLARTLATQRGSDFSGNSDTYAKANNIITKLINKNFYGLSTQTIEHYNASTYWKSVEPNYFFNDHTFNNALQRTLLKIIAAEHQEQEQGHYTFVHTCTRNWNCLYDLQAHLRAITLKKQKKEILLRFDPDLDGTNNHNDRRTTLLKNGTPETYFNDSPIKRDIIFMNHSLLAGGQGSNSLRFFYTDTSFNRRPPVNDMLNKIFKSLKLEKYLTKYRSEIDELLWIHNRCSSYETVFLLSFSPKMLKKTVYVAHPYGRKRTIYIDGIGKTDDVKLILDTLRTSPEKIKDLDNLEYVFIVTKDCGLNPLTQESGDLKIIPFDSADPEKLALYEQKRDELMAKIKADIDAERAGWNEQEKTAHEQTLQQMDEWYSTYNCLNDCKQSRVQEA